MLTSWKGKGLPVYIKNLNKVCEHHTYRETCIQSKRHPQNETTLAWQSKSATKCEMLESSLNGMPINANVDLIPSLDQAQDLNWVSTVWIYEFPEFWIDHSTQRYEHFSERGNGAWFEQTLAHVLHVLLRFDCACLQVICMGMLFSVCGLQGFAICVMHVADFPTCATPLVLSAFSKH